MKALILSPLLLGLSLCFAMLALSGCSVKQPQTIYVPREVKVPVPVPCNLTKLDLGPAPVDTLLQLPDKTSPSQRMAALIQDLEAYRQYSAVLWIGLQSCAKPV